MATLRTFLEWPLRVPLTVAVTVAVLVLAQGEGLFAASATPETNPTWWLNYVYGTQPDGRERVEGAVLGNDESAGTASAAAPKRRRRLIMHRYGGLGNQRYPIGFTGDVAALWESLAFQPAFTAAAANVNFGYWSHDIGGFYEPCEGELFVRWVQFGAFSPIVRIHGFRSAAIEKRPWHYPPRAASPHVHGRTTRSRRRAVAHSTALPRVAA
jgi:alpha-glucosidase (family GH31 glycosyl hydrolase)